MKNENDLPKKLTGRVEHGRIVCRPVIWWEPSQRLRKKRVVLILTMSNNQFSYLTKKKIDTILV